MTKLYRVLAVEVPEGHSGELEMKTVGPCDVVDAATAIRVVMDEEGWKRAIIFRNGVLECTPEPVDATAEIKGLMKAQGWKTCWLQEDGTFQKAEATTSPPESDRPREGESIETQMKKTGDWCDRIVSLEGLMGNISARVANVESGFSSLYLEDVIKLREEVAGLTLLINTLTKIVEEKGQRDHAHLQTTDKLKTRIQNMEAVLVSIVAGKRLDELYTNIGSAMARGMKRASEAMRGAFAGPQPADYVEGTPSSIGLWKWVVKTREDLEGGEDLTFADTIDDWVIYSRGCGEPEQAVKISKAADFHMVKVKDPIWKLLARLNSKWSEDGDVADRTLADRIRFEAENDEEMECELTDAVSEWLTFDTGVLKELQERIKEGLRRHKVRPSLRMDRFLKKLERSEMTNDAIKARVQKWLSTSSIHFPNSNLEEVMEDDGVPAIIKRDVRACLARMNVEEDDTVGDLLRELEPA